MSQQQQVTHKFEKDWLLKLVQKHSPSAESILAVAPMVDQSDLPFRLLCRKYGANLCFTPMIHARNFCEKPNYRKKFFDSSLKFPPQDRPVIAQLCGSNADYLLQTALTLQPHVDGIDLNCGCPQGIAKRGQYGAYLLEQGDHLVSLVEFLSKKLDIPLSVKVRLLPSGVEDSLVLYRRLVNAGASLLTIHGRNRFQKGPLTGQADWDAIQRTVKELGGNIPILANGSISSFQDVQECLQYTGADGIMSSEAILEYPPLFSGVHARPVGRLQLACEYLQLAQTFPPEKGGQGSGLKCIRVHMHRFLHADLQRLPELRTRVALLKSVDEMGKVLQDLQTIHSQENHQVGAEQLSWYVRHRVSDEPPQQANVQEEEPDLEEDNAQDMVCIFGEDDDADY